MGTEQGEHQGKQAKVEEGPRTEIQTNHLPFPVTFLVFVEPVTCFRVSFRSHKNLFLSKLKHGSRQQDFNKKGERAETLQSEYSYYNFRSGELMCP